MKKNIEGSKTAGQALKEKQSVQDQAANRAKQENNMSEREDTLNRNRRDHSEKVSGKGSM